MYITSSTFLTLLSLLLPSMAAPVHFSTASPASRNEIKWHDYGDYSQSSGVDSGRRKYVTHAYEESHDHISRDTSSEGRGVSYQHLPQMHSPDYRKANIMVSSSESNHRHQEAESLYEIEKDNESFDGDEGPEMQRGWGPMATKRGIVRPRQNARLTTTAPNTPALVAAHNEADSNHSNATNLSRPAVKSATPSSRLSVAKLTSLLGINASTNKPTNVSLAIEPTRHRRGWAVEDDDFTSNPGHETASGLETRNGKSM